MSSQNIFPQNLMTITKENLENKIHLGVLSNEKKITVLFSWRIELQKGVFAKKIWEPQREKFDTSICYVLFMRPSSAFCFALLASPRLPVWADFGRKHFCMSISSQSQSYVLGRSMSNCSVTNQVYRKWKEAPFCLSALLWRQCIESRWSNSRGRSKNSLICICLGLCTKLF